MRRRSDAACVTELKEPSGSFFCALLVWFALACARRSRRGLMSPSSELRGTWPAKCCALRGQNRPRQLRRSQAANSEDGSNLSVPCGFEVVTITLANFHVN
jgi:hypothetical protein